MRFSRWVRGLRGRLLRKTSGRWLSARERLRRLLNAGNRRGKSTLSLALRRFAASKNFTTQRWSLEVVDIRKPIIVIKRRP
jgi:hypothetical protein